VPAAQTTAGLPDAPIAAVVPGPDQATMAFRIAVPVAADRQVAYVSSGTVAVRILIGTAQDGTPVYQGALGQPVAGQWGVYEITSVVPVGQQHFTVELYGDEAMTAPMLLATGEADQLIEKGKANRVALTLKGIPRSVQVYQNAPSTSTPNIITAGVRAYDAKGSIITGTYATPVTLALQHTGTQLTPPADLVAETSTETFAFGFTSGTLSDSWITASAPGVEAASVTRSAVIRPCITRLTVTAAVPKAVLVGEPKSGAITATATYSDGRVDGDVDLTVTEPGAGIVDTASGTPTLVLPATNVTYATLIATGKLPRYTGASITARFQVAVAKLTMSPAPEAPARITLAPYGTTTVTGQFEHPDPTYGPPLISFSWEAPYGRFINPTASSTTFEYNGRGLDKTFDATLSVATASDMTWTKKIPFKFNPN
jgi:hypothetical protein